jgi:NagD protein
VEAYVQHLHKMGIPATRDKMYTSSLATIDFMKLEYPDITRIYILGTPSLKEEFAAHGYTVVDGDIEPEVVVVGFDTGLDFKRLCECAWWISKGKTWIATHPDNTCPTNLPTVLVDCGAVCACLEMATGRKPDAVPGKPDARMLQGILRREGLQPHQMAMVGDRLMTDIALAQNTGAVGVLVLTGEATAADAAAAPRKPDFVLESIEVLGQKLRASR